MVWMRGIPAVQGNALGGVYDEHRAGRGDGPLRLAARTSMNRTTCKRATVLLVGLLGCSAHAQVSPQRLLDAEKEPQNWLMYSGNYAGQRFSALEQINSGNVSALAPKWAYQTMAGGK